MTTRLVSGGGATSPLSDRVAPGSDSGSDAPWVAYAPTLRSPGGFRALQNRLEGRLPFLRAAIVAEPGSFAACFPHYGGPVVAVSGHLDGARTLSRALQQHPSAEVVALQNPVLPTVHLAETLLQNNLYATPRALWCVSEGPSAFLRYSVGTVLSFLQVARSDRTIVLNPAYPRAFDALTDVTVLPNRLSQTSLRALPNRTRLRMVAFVGSFHKFRGLHLLLRAFLASRIADEGWKLVVHASPGDRRYRQRCERLASSSPAVDFAPADADTHVTLAQAGFAAFPSRVEGCSIAFLEALHLSQHILALDRPHFRAPTEQPDAPRPRMSWVQSCDEDAWAGALRRAVNARPDSLLR